MKSPKQLLNSIANAINGFWITLKEETSIKIQLFLGMIAITLSFYFEINTNEWFAVILCVAAVLSAETMNSAIENLADKITLEQDPYIKKAKDMGAGAVLVVATASIIIACIIFIPKFIA
jgi:diacylglycerol kinase